ncbi:MAG TPA: hypothetical protein VG734_17930 [Lacunisphaera sp.]|nr:hypothetical protein [Lacunisphaera sp.]
MIRKVAPVSDPATPSGDPRTYGYGVLNLGVSLPVDFVIVGWLMNTPVVGEIVRVLRVTRNSTIMPGIFTTTEVTKIPRSGEFHTANSIYLWSEIAEAPEVLVPKATPRKSGGDLQDDLDAVRGDR